MFAALLQFVILNLPAKRKNSLAWQAGLFQNPLVTVLRDADKSQHDNKNGYAV